jgi:hypothetical protein
MRLALGLFAGRLSRMLFLEFFLLFWIPVTHEYVLLQESHREDKKRLYHNLVKPRICMIFLIFTKSWRYLKVHGTGEFRHARLNTFIGLGKALRPTVALGLATVIRGLGTCVRHTIRVSGLDNAPPGKGCRRRDAKNHNTLDNACALPRL